MPSDKDRLRVVPIILNVKNFDLFHIDRRGQRYDPAKYATEWKRLGIADPAPFTGVRYLSRDSSAASTCRSIRGGRSPT